MTQAPDTRGASFDVQCFIMCVCPVWTVMRPSHKWRRREDSAAPVGIARATVLAEVLQHDSDHRLVGHTVILEVEGLIRTGDTDGPDGHTCMRVLSDEAQRAGHPPK